MIKGDDVVTYKWSEGNVSIHSRLVAKKLWLTIDIIVEVDGESILNTGGVFKTESSHSAKYSKDGKTYIFELSWRKYTRKGHPITLRIDDVEVFKSVVLPKYHWLGYWPLVLTWVLSAAMIFYFW